MASKASELLFQSRLQEVHKELDAAIRSSTDQRDALAQNLRGYAGAGGVTFAAPMPAQHGAARAAALDVAATLEAAGSGAARHTQHLYFPQHASSERVALEVQELVQRHLQAFDARLEAAVSREWQRYAVQMEQAFKERFSQLSAAQEQTTKLLRQVAEGLSSSTAQTKRDMERLEAYVTNALDGMKRDSAEAHKSQHREYSELKESITVLGDRYRLDLGEYARRADAAQRRANDAAIEVTAVAEAKSISLKSEIEAKLREVTGRLSDDIDLVRRHQNQLNNQTRVMEDTVNKIYLQLAETLDDVTAQKSTLREVRAELVRVDTHVRDRISRIAGGTGQTLLPPPAKAAGGGAHDTAAGLVQSSNPDIARLQLDMRTVKEAIAFIASSLQQRHLLNVAVSDADVVVHAVAAAAAGFAAARSRPSAASGDLDIDTPRKTVGLPRAGSAAGSLPQSPVQRRGSDPLATRAAATKLPLYQASQAAERPGSAAPPSGRDERGDSSERDGGGDGWPLRHGGGGGAGDDTSLMNRRSLEVSSVSGKADSNAQPTSVMSFGAHRTTGGNAGGGGGSRGAVANRRFDDSDADSDDMHGSHLDNSRLQRSDLD